MKKRAQSNIIITVLIVLVALAAVAVIAVFIINQVRDNVQTAEVRAKVSSIEIGVVEANVGNNYLLLQRTSNNPDIVIANVSLNINGDSKPSIIDLSNGWSALETKKVNFTNYILKRGDKIDVVVIAGNAQKIIPVLLAKSEVVKASSNPLPPTYFLDTADYSLVAWFPLNAVSGFNDSSKSSNNSSCLTSCPVLNTTGGRNGGSTYTFTGNSALSFPTNLLPYGNSSRTLCGWGNTFSNYPYWRWLVAYGVSGPSAFIGMNVDGISLDGSGSYGLDLAAAKPGYNWTIGSWQQVCLTYNSITSNVSLYGNGILLTSQIQIPGASVWNTTQSVAYIGTQTNNNIREYWNGSISDIRIYNRALTSDEIQTIYNAG